MNAPIPGLQLTLTDAAVLTTLTEGDAHGFKVAAEFARTGELGAIWTLQRTQIYRALDHLERASLIVPVWLEAGDAGPARTVYRATPAGRAWSEVWLATPVDRLRQGRNGLRLKLAFWLRSGRDPGTFWRRRRTFFRPSRARSKPPCPPPRVSPGCRCCGASRWRGPICALSRRCAPSFRAVSLARCKLDRADQSVAF